MGSSASSVGLQRPTPSSPNLEPSRAHEPVQVVDASPPRHQVNDRGAEPTDRHRISSPRVGRNEPSGDPGVQDTSGIDELARFSPAIINVRWVTSAVALVLAGAGLITLDGATILACLVVSANTLYRARRPIRHSRAHSAAPWLLAEVALVWSAVALTGFWESPLIVVAAAMLVVAGFAGGYRMASTIGLIFIAGLGAASLATSNDLTVWTANRLTQPVQWITILLLTGVISGYARGISGQAEERHSETLTRLSQLSDANNLLFNLHRVAQTLPASLDQTEVLQSSLTKLRGLINFDRAIFLLIEDTDRSWTVARQQAMGGTDSYAATALPAAAKQSIAKQTMVTADNYAPGVPPGGSSSLNSGFHPNSRCGLYAPLMARDRLIGLVAIETDGADGFADRDQQTMQSFVEPVALAIDNARWFARLRRSSVDEERSRIARELHDRIGQSLVCLGFDTDRVVRHYDAGTDITNELDDLRAGVRAATSEIRDALYDLRTDVAENRDFAKTVRDFATRLGERSNLHVSIDATTTTRLPILQEREMWRIAQEALINVERHAESAVVYVTWRCDADSALLTIKDEGKGMAVAHAGRADSYGIVGMRERANSIGAALEIISKSGEGTTVQCYLKQT